MKIAVLAPLYYPINPTSAGGSEVWTSQFIINSIKNKDVEIDLYAIDGSISQHPQLNVIPVFDRGFHELAQLPYVQSSSNAHVESQKILYSLFGKALALLKKNEDKYDLIIDSSGKFAFSISWDIFSKPLLVIGHNPITHGYSKLFADVPLPKNVFFVFPSLYQLNSASWISESIKHCIPHGIPIDEIPYQDSTDKDHITWMGRINPKSPKGVDEVIKLGSIVNKHIDIYGSIENQDYFEKEIQPILKPNISLITDQQTKPEVFKRSRVFVYPIQWEEPFGLVFLEAMASGTPVIAYARGSVPEVIKDGETGFIVNSSEDDKRGDWIIKKTGIEGLCEAVERIYAMPEEEYLQMRKNCREHVEKNFTVERMVDQYESLYKEIVEKNKNSLAH